MIIKHIFYGKVGREFCNPKEGEELHKVKKKYTVN